MTIDSEVIEVLYGFIPGGLKIGYFEENAQYYKKGMTCTMEVEFCYGYTTYAKDGKSFSVEITRSSISAIPVGTVITFTKQE